MFIEVKEDFSVEYPVDIYTRFPNTSFPDPLQQSDLPVGIYMVQITEKPVTDIDYDVVEGTPVFDQTKNSFVQNWTLVPVDAEELKFRLTELAAKIRSDRNAKLAETDWTQLSDVPQITKDKYKHYRQLLRDITSQDEFPRKVTFPDKPE